MQLNTTNGPPSMSMSAAAAGSNDAAVNSVTLNWFLVASYSCKNILWSLFAY